MQILNAEKIQAVLQLIHVSVLWVGINFLFLLFNCNKKALISKERQTPVLGARKTDKNVLSNLDPFNTGFKLKLLRIFPMSSLAYHSWILCKKCIVGEVIRAYFLEREKCILIL